MDKPHKKLDVWKMSMELVEEVYRITGQFPGEERFGLVSQMRRSAASIPCNIAEGFARKSHKEIVQFIHLAMGSASELDTQLEICRRLSLGTAKDLDGAAGTLTRVDKMLVGLRNHFLKKPASVKAKSS